MASAVDICNRALQKLGQPRITSLSDNSVAARACSTAYDPRRLALLRKHRWSFAIQRFQLPASATPPTFGPLNAYPLPSGWLKVLPPDPIQNTNDRDWIIEGGAILSDWAPPLSVKIVMNVTDTTLMDPLFCEALSADISVEMCEALTQSNTKKQAALVDLKTAIEEAKKANAIEQVPVVSNDDTWITMRG